MIEGFQPDAFHEVRNVLQIMILKLELRHQNPELCCPEYREFVESITKDLDKLVIITRDKRKKPRN